MAFPRFHGDPNNLPPWQGRQPKQYIVSGEVGYLVRNPSSGPIDNLSGFVAGTLREATDLVKDDNIAALLAALDNREGHRTTGLPDFSILFTPVKVEGELMDDETLFEAIRAV